MKVVSDVKSGRIITLELTEKELEYIVLTIGRTTNDDDRETYKARGIKMDDEEIHEIASDVYSTLDNLYRRR
jgi:ribosomal 50S subunit-recycling heat shock protein